MARLIDANEAKAFAAECWPKPEYRIAIDALLDNCPNHRPGARGRRVLLPGVPKL